MKKLMLLLSIMSLFSFVLSAKEISVESSIKGVTVYQQGATVSRTGKTSLPAGTSTIVFTGLTQNLNANTVQVGGKGDFTILSVQYQMYYPYANDAPKEVKQLQDSLKFYLKEKSAADNRVWAYEKEAQMIMANQTLTSKETSVSVAQLTAMADFYRKRLNDITDKKYMVSLEAQKLNLDIQRIQNELNQKGQWRNTREGKVVVEVAALRPVTANLTLSYYVHGAWWTPMYDLRAGDDAKMLETSFKANVTQSTGVDWKGVSLKFSTAQAHLDNTRPETHTWWLNFMGVPQPLSIREAKAETDGYMISQVADKEREDRKAKSLANSTVEAQNMLNLSYEIQQPFDVPSDSNPHKVEVKQLDIPMTVNYYVVPSMDETVFLVANIDNWSQYNLLAGNANLFYDNTYVGQAYINSRSVEDTLKLSLGRDNGIIVKRELIKDRSARKVMGGSIKETKSYEITIRNTKNTHVEVNIDEMYPVSVNKDISVKLIAAEGAKIDEDKGFLSWQKTIKPGESVKLIYTFEVRYPKGHVINL